MKRKHFCLFRVCALSLVLCLILGLAACSSGAETRPPDEKPDTGAVVNGDGTPADPAKSDDGTPGDPGSIDGPDRPVETKAPEFYYDGKSSDGAYGANGGSPAEPAAPGAGEGAGTAELGEGGEGRTDSDPPIGLDDPVAPEPSYNPGEALKLTAAEWNDNANWPFFTNLVNAGTISFPAFGIDPRNRIEVLVTDEAETPLENQSVTLLGENGEALWTARTDKAGAAFLFWAEGQTPDRVVCGGAEAAVRAEEPSGDPQGGSVMRPLDRVVLRIASAAPARNGLQVMFIVDTTGSMSDEIAFLQKDFSAIAERAGGDGIQWSVSFYRDEGDDYVTRHNPFTSDVAEIQRKLNAEYADGGGDEPEAVAQVLRECLSERSDWEPAAAKLAFLIFDAPPHQGKDAELRAAIQSAAEKGVRLIPVVASNANRDTELFGRALAICTNGTYVFLTDDSGVGESHLEPIVGDYTVELLQDLIVKIIDRYLP
ncbi:MAG: VWA domain-containing protein [Oscillospiraceae bacterium]|nr:VWA domain-containing protein [Oscillospiraceae bacterium]